MCGRWALAWLLASLQCGCPAAEQVLVLGAGAAGIAAARRLKLAGVDDILVLEGGNYIGGRMKSVEFAGKTVELGANWVQGTEGSWLWDLVQEYGIKCNNSDWDNWVDYDSNGVIEDDSMRWDDLGSLEENLAYLSLNYSAASETDINVRVAANLVGWRSKNKYDEALLWSLVDYEGAGPPRTTGLKEFFPVSVYEDFEDADCCVTDQRGWNSLLERWAADAGLTGKIRLGKVVTDIAEAEGGAGVTVTTKDGETFQGEHVIVTFSVGVLENELVNFDPPLPDWKLKEINKFDMNTYMRIFLEFPENFWNDTEFQMYVDDTRGYYPLWQNMNAEVYFGAGPPYIYMVTVTDFEALRIERQPENATRAEIMAVLRAMYPHKSVPDPIQMLIPKWHSDPLFKGSYSNWPIGVTPADHELLCRPVGRIWFAGEVCHASYNGWVHGALLSGHDTATALARCRANPAECPEPYARPQPPTCGDVRAAYRSSGCCGAPDRPFDVAQLGLQP